MMSGGGSHANYELYPLEVMVASHQALEDGASASGKQTAKSHPHAPPNTTCSDSHGLNVDRLGGDIEIQFFAHLGILVSSRDGQLKICGSGTHDTDTDWKQQSTFG